MQGPRAPPRPDSRARSPLERRAGDELRHEAVLQLDRDSGGDPQGRRRVGRHALGTAVDSQQRRVLSRLSDHVLASPESRAEIAVCDAAIQWTGRAGGRTQSGLETLQDVVQIRHRVNTWPGARRCAGYTFKQHEQVDPMNDPSDDALTAEELIGRADLEGARDALQGVAVRTPTIRCAELAAIAGMTVALKAECLQVTGSFKLRGALYKVAALGERARPGLAAASAGNHARALAQAALVRGLPCEVFMPRDASVSKVAAVERLHAHVRLEGSSVEEALELAREWSRETGAALVHPFDDIDVIAGQGTLGTELLEEVPDLARVVVPVGGGGLASGIGIALRRAGATVELVGVQARACSPYLQALDGDAAPGELEAHVGATIADGIAIRRPGALTLPLLRSFSTGGDRDRGRDRLRDGVPRGELKAGERGGRRRRRGGAPERPAPPSRRDDRRGRFRRERRQRAARRAAAQARNPGGSAGARLHPRGGPAGWPGGATRRSWPEHEQTS